MKRFVQLLGLCVCLSVQANEVDTELDVSVPDVETVLNIYNFCVEQYSQDEDSDTESFLLNCVNADLKASAYKIFSSYNELKSFVDIEHEV